MSEQQSLLPESASAAPLADRMRPVSLDEFFGQHHLLGEQATLRNAIDHQMLHSMIFWGPPGTGKTTLARMLAGVCDSGFVSLSAVLSGVKDIRAAVQTANDNFVQSGRRTLLFVDEVHRFNKAQQDAFLPHIEDGTFYFIGATTENPSFALNNALLSRVRVYILKRLEIDDISRVIQRALTDRTRGLGGRVAASSDIVQQLAAAADGDARRSLVLLELACDLALAQAPQQAVINEQILAEVTRDSLRHFDRGGDIFYDQISAMHKSVRGSDPDAALYWFCRMIDGGCDPAYLARRIVRIASEDIGNADPRALHLALDAWVSFERLGSPEGELMLAQAVLYLAAAAKSNAAYVAYKRAMELAASGGNAEVPVHLRNAPTAMMKSMGHGADYRYSHDEEGAFSAGQRYFPEGLDPGPLYEPVDRGLESQIRSKLDYLRGRNSNG